MDIYYFGWISWPSAEIVSAYAELLKALQWPLVAGVLVVFFKKEIAKMMSRIKQVEGLGTTISLDKDLDNLQESVAIQESEANSTAEQDVAADLKHPRTSNDWDSIPSMLARQEREAIETIAVSPTAGVMLVSSLIESALRTIVKNKGVQSNRPSSVPILLGELQKMHVLPSALIANVQEFWRIRNQIVHGHEVPSQDIVRAADVGLAIYRSLSTAVHESKIDAMQRRSSAVE